jgi:hypothetical protein
VTAKLQVRIVKPPLDTRASGGLLCALRRKLHVWIVRQTIRPVDTVPGRTTLPFTTGAHRPSEGNGPWCPDSNRFTAVPRRFSSLERGEDGDLALSPTPRPGVELITRVG